MIRTFSVLLSCWLVAAISGCGPKTVTSPMEPEPAPSVVVEPAPEPAGPPMQWTSGLITGRLAIGNPFPALPVKGNVIGTPWDGIKPGERTLVYLHSYYETADDNEFTPLNQIKAFGKTFAEQAAGYRLLVLMNNLQMSDEMLERVSQAVGKSESISVGHDVANFVQRRLISPSASAGIPKVFVIGEDGMIDWMGDPVELPSVLIAIRDGKFDREAAHVAYEEHVADSRVEYDASYQYAEAFKAKDYDRAVMVADDRLEAEPENYAWLGMKYEALVRAERHTEINDVLRKLSEANLDDEEWLAETAYNIAGGKTGNDLDMALEFATLANELTDGTNQAVMHTMAVVHAARKEYAQAIEWEEKTIATTDDGGVAFGLDVLLKEYREKLAETNSATPEPTSTDDAK